MLWGLVIALAGVAAADGGGVFKLRRVTCWRVFARRNVWLARVWCNWLAGWLIVKRTTLMRGRPVCMVQLVLPC